MPTEFSIPDKSDPPNQRQMPSLSETVMLSMSDIDLLTEAGPPRKFWDWLAFFVQVTTVYRFLALGYRWLRPDPEFLDFSTRVTKLPAILLNGTNVAEEYLPSGRASYEQIGHWDGLAQLDQLLAG